MNNRVEPPYLFAASQEATAVLRASANTVRRPGDEATTVVPRPRGRPPACDEEALETLRQQLEAEPGLTVAEHRAQFASDGRSVPSITTVWRRLEDLRVAARRRSVKPASSTHWRFKEGKAVVT